MISRQVALPISGILALLVAAPTFGRLAGATSEFKDGSRRPVSIALLPPQASVSTQRLIKNEAELEESTDYGLMFVAKIAELLEAQGYQVEIIDATSVNSDPQLQEYVIDANRRYEEMLSTVRVGRIKRRLYNGGDEARLLANYLGVDSIGFPQLAIVGATGGKMAMSIFLGGSMGGSAGTLSLVDGDSADLEAHLVGLGSNSAKKFEEDPETEIYDIAESMLKGLPDADPSARVERDLSDDDVLSEIESLLGE